MVCAIIRSLPILLRQCGTLRALQSIHAAMVKTSMIQDSFCMNQFIVISCRFHQIIHAHQAFDEMSHPNVFVYNALIGGLVQHSHALPALGMYKRMLRSLSVPPTSYTFTYLLKACSGLLDLSLGDAVHGQIRKTDFACHIVVQTGLVDFYSNVWRIAEAKRVFDEMFDKDVIAWTAMLSGVARVGDMESAGRVFEHMPEKCIVSWNTMLAGYARTGDVEMAALVFHDMPDKDLVSWTTMISCYSQNKRFTDAIEAFQAMTGAGINPDKVTMATVISACAHLGAVELGRELHLYAMLHGLTLDVYLGSALIDMFGKCGSVERALGVFYKLPEKNLFCWNAMIEALAAHGYALEALAMFGMMKTTACIEPNDVSFLSALSACTHAGLVEEGCRLFSGMTSDYSIVPQVEHYGCMVDLLGRAGLLQEALRLVQSMQALPPNAVIWGSLLSSCKVHGHKDIGVIAARQLLALEPVNGARHMLLVSMYAEAKRWAEVVEVRRMATRRRAETTGRGISWIEIERTVHEFAAGDASHRCHAEIELMLSELHSRLRTADCSEEEHISFSS